MNTRKIALDLLARYDAGEAYINLAIGRACETLPDSDRRYLTALIYGTVERLITLDYYIGALARRSEIDPTTRDILRLGLYELLYMHTPAHAAVNECVKLTRTRGEASFVNGILRAAVRNPARLVPPPREKNLARHLSVAYSVPLRTVRLLLDILGEQTEAFLTSVNTPRGMTLHVNTTRTTRDDYIAALAAEGIESSPTPNADSGITLTSSLPPRALPDWDGGYAWVQDEASQIAIQALGCKPDMTVVDVCACPGGKSFAAACEMQGKGHILSRDLHASKLSLITDGAARLGLSCIEVGEHDATVLDPALVGSADRVICDVPCSGLGVLSKKADLRYKDMEAADRLPALQTSILETVSQYVKAGGVLLYSTCTINPMENEGVTDAFLASHPDFAPLDFTVGNLVSNEGHLTLYPHIHGTDGFYIALLKRRDL